MAAPTSQNYEIRELGVGGILDQAIRIVRDNFGPMLTILAPSVLFNVLVGLAAIMVAPVIDPQAPAAERAAAFERAIPATFAVQLLAIVGGLVLLSWVNASLIHFVAQRYLGNPITPGAAMARGWSRFGAVVWTTLLFSVALIFGFLLLIIPGIYFSFWYLLSQEVAVVEGISGYAAMKRSKALIKGSLNQAFLVLFVLGLLGFAIGAGAGFIPNPYLTSIVSAILNSVVGLVSLTAIVVLYFSCRCKQENFDLEHLATTMGRLEHTAGTGV